MRSLKAMFALWLGVYPAIMEEFYRQDEMHANKENHTVYA